MSLLCLRYKPQSAISKKEAIYTVLDWLAKFLLQGELLHKILTQLYSTIILLSFMDVRSTAIFLFPDNKNKL